MKMSFAWCFCALLSCQRLFAAELALTIDLPQAELLLAPVSPPQLQQEGSPLPRERALLTELVALISTTGQGYEAVLTRARESLAAELLLLEQGDPDGDLEARAVADGFADVSSSSISATMLYILGHSYMALEQYLPAEAAFKAALRPLPDFVRAHESLGLMYLRNERYEDAHTHLVRAAELGLKTANLYGALGYVNQQTRNYWGAAAAFQQALMLQHDNPSWENGLLNALSNTHQYQAGLTLAEQMLQKYPDESVIWLYRSQFALQAGENQTALSSLETALRLGDDSVANMQICATLHLELGSVARAVDLLSMGAAQGLEFRYLDQALAWLIQKEEWDYVQQLLDDVVPNAATLTESEQSSLLTRQAGLSVHNGEQQQARSALQRALELDPGNADALMTLASLHRAERNFNQAELLYQRASAYDLHRENALIALAQLAIDQENFERALQLLRDVVARNPARSDLSRNIESLESLVLLQTDN
jgi:tetratricopeptide (TPR) repeat protein